MSKSSALETNILLAQASISGLNGSIRIFTTAYSGAFSSIRFSEDSTVSAIADTNGEDKTAYFATATYTVKAGDTLTAKDLISGNRFSGVMLSAGSAILTL